MTIIVSEMPGAQWADVSADDTAAHYKIHNTDVCSRHNSLLMYNENIQATESTT